jgi:hypothetical protein
MVTSIITGNLLGTASELRFASLRSAHRSWQDHPPTMSILPRLRASNFAYVGDMENTKTLSGSCFCGAVQISVTGDPAAMGYCHCSSCRLWSASPVNRFTLWPVDAVKVVKGADELGVYHKTDNSFRKWCRRCGGHVMTEHPPWKLVDVYHAVIPQLPFKPGLHVNYSETVLPMKDGLPKLKDFPKEFGGSGESVAE